MLLASIRKTDCIGCSKCIQACPVDAIIGAKKFLHYVLEIECIGCKLCVDPCPVDCIQMIPRVKKINKQQIANKAKMRHIAKTNRLHKESKKLLTQRNDNIKSEILESIKRAKNKKNLMNDNK